MRLTLNNRLLLIQKHLIDYFYTLKVWLVFQYRKHFHPNQRNRVQVLVSSHINYIDKTFEPLTSSMVRAGILPENVHFFIGGADKEEQIIKEGFTLNYVCYNAFDLTALIGAIEQSITSAYYFLLHDTCLIQGKRFTALIQYYPLKPCYTYSILNFPSKNIGIYSQESLCRWKDVILSFKLMAHTSSEIQGLKKMAVENEDIVFRLNTPLHQVLFPKFSGTTKKSKVDYWGSERFEEKIPSVGMIKYTANTKRVDVYRTTL